ncbi:Hypothetical predicted protein [Podarcis lilfordi]|uniref:Uncharacterized protein n=1 Tax=Podarcis lilfordi TaxID=74358 RepID=A0AA35KNZ3_9SAUR|nr:Hypothetical predicted protein [Podarcis lilfordi]
MSSLPPAAGTSQAGLAGSAEAPGPSDCSHPKEARRAPGGGGEGGGSSNWHRIPPGSVSSRKSNADKPPCGMEQGRNPGAQLIAQSRF